MAVHPRAPYPDAPKLEGLNRKRLWFLFHALGFDREQVATLTGTPVAEVTAALTNYRINRRHSLHPTGHDLTLLWALIEQLHLAPLKEESPLRRRGGEVARRELRRYLREAMASGRISWKAIDEPPTTTELAN